ncbi:MAG: pentapeptide repeat-containing protein, partial [Candidatus Entotheonellia bacterium]
EVLRTRYEKAAPELLEEDFRTATFVLRPDDSQESFRFAHTSLQEYFLARYLLRALVENEPEKWEMPVPSPETLDFLGQLLAILAARQQGAAIHVIEHLLESYRPRATDIALRYWLLAIRHDDPAPTPARVDLHGADLSGLTIRGWSAEQPLNLTDADLSETQLVATRFEHVDLSGANLMRDHAEHAEFHHVLARDLTVRETDMTAAIWRYCDALGLRGGTSADWYECQWIGCDIDPDTLPEDFGHLGTISPGSTSGQPVPDGRDSEVTTVLGHSGGVLACAFAPDGSTLASGSADGTLRVWDTRTGELCMTLVNAPNSQTAALDERGNRILAASPDAWRYLGWRYFDPQANRLRILPAEHFGPLPVG